MMHRYPRILTNAVLLLLLMMLMSAHAFTVTTPQQQHKVTTRFRLSAATDKDDDRQEVIFVDPGNEGDAISQDLWEEIEGAQPPKWLVMKEVSSILVIVNWNDTQDTAMRQARSNASSFLKAPWN